MFCFYDQQFFVSPCGVRSFWNRPDVPCHACGKSPLGCGKEEKLKQKPVVQYQEGYPTASLSQLQPKHPRMRIIRSVRMTYFILRGSVQSID